MPPRRRRIGAQRQQEEDEEEREEAPEESTNSSLRSFFPLEIIKLILRELDGDLPSLASVCLVSFGCLEEASGELYRDPVARSGRGIISLLCGTKLKPQSRLIPSLALSQAQTITLYGHHCSNELVPHLVEKSGISLPPRLLVPVALDRLLLLSPSSKTDREYFDLDSYLTFILPHLSPIRTELNFNSISRSPLAPTIIDYFDWTRTFIAWGSRFRSLTVRGNANQLAQFLGKHRHLILRDSPYIQSGGTFELTL